MKGSLLSSVIAVCCLFAGCDPPALSKKPIDEKALLKMDESLLGIWKLRGDTDRLNHFVVRQEPAYENAYSVTYMSNSGSNPLIDNGRVYFSDINGEKFINVHYNVISKERMDWGFLFVKVTRYGPDDIDGVVVNDPVLAKLTTSAEVRKQIAANMHKPGYYISDTVHLEKRPLVLIGR